MNKKAVSPKLSGWKFDATDPGINVDGKTYWPDCVTVVMDRREALRCARQVLGSLEEETYSDSVRFTVSFCGKMSREDDE